MKPERYLIEYLFAIVAVCQKGSMPINAGDHAQRHVTKITTFD